MLQVWLVCFVVLWHSRKNSFSGLCQIGSSHKSTDVLSLAVGQE